MLAIRRATRNTVTSIIHERFFPMLRMMTEGQSVGMRKKIFSVNRRAGCTS
jgi:hypothetical protein